MQFNQLRYVLETADKKSFYAAAKSLFVSQPSLSQQIMNLEKELGIPLFIRHSKSVSLTEAGEYFVQSARRILNDTEQLNQKIILPSKASSFRPDLKRLFSRINQYRKMTCGFLSSPVIINRRESIFGGLL